MPEHRFISLEAHQGEGYGASPSALAWLDLTTGEFTTSACDLAQIPALMARIQPKELLLTQSAYEALQHAPWFLEWRNLTSIRPEVQFTANAGKRRIEEHFRVASTTSFGEFTPEEHAACGALIDYVTLTQMEASARLDPPQRELTSQCLHMDSATRRNLELTHTLGGQRRGSLLATMDETVTAGGSRMLGAWLSAPLATLAPIRARHDAIAWALAETKLREQWRAQLKSIADMERALGRLSLGRGGPRDLLLLATSLTATNALHEGMRPLMLPALLAEARSALQGHHALAEQLTAALKPEVGLFARDGNFIADGYRADLDQYRRLRDESKRVIAAMEGTLKTQTGIPSLKIKHNNVLGYFIEITPLHEKKVPPEFIHRQGLAGALRYSTKELAEIALAIEQAADKALKLELQLFEELRFTTLARGKEIVAAARALATLDCILALATKAEAERWTRPNMHADTRFTITAGRHPVVEAALARTHEEFVANDCCLGEEARGQRPEVRGQGADSRASNSPLEGESLERSERGDLKSNAEPNRSFSDSVGGNDAASTPPTQIVKDDFGSPSRGELGALESLASLATGDRLLATPYLLLLTGPNMGGKSTFLRQQAILTILAQMGSFVPAEAASIGLVDKLFCRVGAADDLARGQSTFMVEMVETASILHQATARSLVVLDEIGRGTATYDGVSIAWAVAEYLHDVTRCRALFATHYHELTALAASLPRLRNFHATAKEYRGKLIFLHTIREGFADKSYGIHVAALAGMPRAVLTRARALLSTLESGHSLTERDTTAEALPLFAHARAAHHAPEEAAPHTASTEHQQLIERLATLDVNNLTPLAALQALHELNLKAKSIQPID